MPALNGIAVLSHCVHAKTSCSEKFSLRKLQYQRLSPYLLWSLRKERHAFRFVGTFKGFGALMVSDIHWFIACCAKHWDHQRNSTHILGFLVSACGFVGFAGAFRYLTANKVLCSMNTDTKWSCVMVFVFWVLICVQVMMFYVTVKNQFSLGCFINLVLLPTSPHISVNLF